jgi:hypothetical protein
MTTGNLAIEVTWMHKHAPFEEIEYQPLFIIPPVNSRKEIIPTGRWSGMNAWMIGKSLQSQGQIGPYSINHHTHKGFTLRKQRRQKMLT